MKRRIKNSQSFSNVLSIEESGIINLKTGEVARLFEVSAIDLSLTSKSEINNFFNELKYLYQIPNLNLKCYKLDERLNLNQNKENLDELIKKYSSDKNRVELLNERKKLIDNLEENKFTISSKYYWVFIAKNIETLNKQIDEMMSIVNGLSPKLDVERIDNKLLIYKFLSNLYLTTNSLDNLIWYDLPDLISPSSLKEKNSQLKVDDQEVQVLTIKSVPPFIDDLFFENIFNYPNVRGCISIKDAISQEELIRWVNNQYQFLLSDRNTTKKLSDATELDIQKENFQVLMNDIKSGDEKIKEVSLTLIICGSKEERENTISDIKRLASLYQIKLDIPKLRQMELWQNYDITPFSLKDYSFYLPTLSLSAGFPFTKSSFNDTTGFMLGVDIHTALPMFFDNFTLNNSRTSHNIVVISSTGGGKTFTIKKLLVNEYSKGSKIFILDAENEYEKLVKINGGEYIDLYSRNGGIINPLQIRYITGEDVNENIKETDCPLAKHLSFLETFFKIAFENISEKEIVMLLGIIESLYNKYGIYKNTSINTLQNLKNTSYPIFTDLYNYLPEYKSRLTSNEQVKIVEQLEILISRFLTGTDAFLFDGYTSIDLSNDLIAFNLQELLYSGNQRLINTQTLNLLSYLNNSIVSNKIRNDKSNMDNKKIIIAIDEFHLYIDENNYEVLRNIGQLARRIRKYSGAVIVSTQSIKDFVGSNEILRHSTAIFNNCQYKMVGMLKEDDLLAYMELFKNNPLTETQRQFLMNAKRGEFLLNIDMKNRLKVWVRTTKLERILMGENEEVEDEYKK